MAFPEGPATEEKGNGHLFLRWRSNLLWERKRKRIRNNFWCNRLRAEVAIGGYLEQAGATRSWAWVRTASLVEDLLQDIAVTIRQQAETISVMRSLFIESVNLRSMYGNL